MFPPCGLRAFGLLRRDGPLQLGLSLGGMRAQESEVQSVRTTLYISGGGGEFGTQN